MANVQTEVIDLTADSDDEGVTLAAASSHNGLAGERIVATANRSAKRRRVQEEAQAAGVIDLTGEDDAEGITASRRTRIPNGRDEENNEKRKDPLPQPRRATSLPPLRRRQISPLQPPLVQEDSAADRLKPIDTTKLFKVTRDSLDPAVVIEGGVVLFADGSRLEHAGSSGCGIAYLQGIRWTGRAIALGQVANPSEPEVSAVREAIRLVPSVLGPNQHRVLIYTDSQATIQHIGYEIANHLPSLALPYALIREIVNETAALKKRGITVEFRWVKGHNVCLGNLMADELAGMGSRESEMAAALGNRLGPNRREINVGEGSLMTTSEACRRRANQRALDGKDNPAVVQERLAEKTQRREERRRRKQALRRRNMAGGAASGTL